MEEENTAREIEEQQDANATDEIPRITKKNRDNINFLFIAILVALMLVSAFYVVAAGANSDTINKAAKYEFYKKIITEYEEKANTCKTPIVMFCT